MLNTYQAIDIAIKSTEEYKAISEAKRKEAIRILKQIQKKDCYNKWTKENIIECLIKWRDKHGKPPTTTNLKELGMPHPVTIQKHFNMSPANLLKQLFPEIIPFNKTIINEWRFTTEQEWLNCFIEQFNKHIDEDMSSKRYDLIRDKNTPTWNTIARHCNVTGWLELMNKAGVKYPNKINTATNKDVTIKKAKSPILIEWDKLLTRQEKHLKELYDVAAQIKV